MSERVICARTPTRAPAMATGAAAAADARGNWIATSWPASTRERGTRTSTSAATPPHGAQSNDCERAHVASDASTPSNSVAVAGTAVSLVFCTAACGAGAASNAATAGRRAGHLNAALGRGADAAGALNCMRTRGEADADATVAGTATPSTQCASGRTVAASLIVTIVSLGACGVDGHSDAATPAAGVRGKGGAATDEARRRLSTDAPAAGSSAAASARREKQRATSADR